jgi:hypothetical protein
MSGEVGNEKVKEDEKEKSGKSFPFNGGRTAVLICCSTQQMVSAGSLAEISSREAAIEFKSSGVAGAR